MGGRWMVGIRGSSWFSDQQRCEAERRWVEQCMLAVMMDMLERWGRREMGGGRWGSNGERERKVEEWEMPHAPSGVTFASSALPPYRVLGCIMHRPPPPSRVSATWSICSHIIPGVRHAPTFSQCSGCSMYPSVLRGFLPSTVLLGYSVLLSIKGYSSVLLVFYALSLESVLCSPLSQGNPRTLVLRMFPKMLDCPTSISVKVLLNTKAAPRPKLLRLLCFTPLIV